MKPIFPINGHLNFHLPNVIKRKALIEEPDEWSYCATGVVVFRLAEQERGSAFDIAQIDVVAPSILPVLETTRTTSGSGLFQEDIG